MASTASNPFGQSAFRAEDSSSPKYSRMAWVMGGMYDEGVSEWYTLIPKQRPSPLSTQAKLLVNLVSPDPPTTAGARSPSVFPTRP